METRKQAWTTAFERYFFAATLTQGSSAVTVSGDGVASCTGTSGVYSVVLNDKWTDFHVSILPELDHDTIATNELITLANELKADYNAHRVLTAGSVHGAADSTNVTAAANATTLATVYVLLNELKVDYEAHRVLTAGSVHGGADATNTISASDATTLATAVTLANELKTDFNAHRVLTAGSVHGAADSTNVVASASITVATTPYPSIVSASPTLGTLSFALKNPTTGANAAMKAGGKIHLLFNGTRR